MARAGAVGAHTTCAGLGPSAGRAGRGRLGWEWRLRRQECVLRSEQLGMRPRCDPTVRTAPSHNRG